MKQVIVISAFLTGCAGYSNVPVSSTVYEEHRTLIAENVKLKDQTMVENQPLKKYQVNGKLVYCTDTFSFNFDMYRCFAFEGLQLTHGLNPSSQEYEPLPNPIKIKQIGRKAMEPDN